MLKTILLTALIAFSSTAVMAEDRDYSTRCCSCAWGFDGEGNNSYTLIRYFGNSSCRIYGPDDSRNQMDSYRTHNTEKKCFADVRKQKNCKKEYYSHYLD